MIFFFSPTERRDCEEDTRGGKLLATHKYCLSQLPSMHHARRTDGIHLKLVRRYTTWIFTHKCGLMLEKKTLKRPYVPHTSSKQLMSATLKLKDYRRHEYLNEAFHLKGAWCTHAADSNSLVWYECIGIFNVVANNNSFWIKIEVGYQGEKPRSGWVCPSENKNKINIFFIFFLTLMISRNSSLSLVL